MKVLVVYATRHGATRGIAERIADTLAREGLDATLRSVHEPVDPRQYSAFVVGSAVYAFHWLSEAMDFVGQHHDLLASRPLWLFSSGPLGTETVDADGHDVRTPPAEIVELQRTLKAVDHAVFFGAYDPTAKPIGVMERITRIMPATKDLLQAGDFRDWEHIESWASSIAVTLSDVPAGVR